MPEETLYFVIGQDGQQYGPASGHDVSEWLESGRLTPETLSWSVGEPTWQPLRLRPALSHLRKLPPLPASLRSPEIESAQMGAHTPGSLTSDPVEAVEPASPADTVAQMTTDSRLVGTVEAIEDNPVVQLVKGPWAPFMRYERTRRAIHKGDQLYAYSKSQLRSKDLMGPWTFNLTETAAIALPITALIKLLDFIWPVTPNIPSGTPPLAAAILSIFPGVVSSLQTIVIPLTLTLVSGICARASLYAKDSTPTSRRRARDAYLYLDGAYGAVPQLCFALGISLIVWFSTRGAWTEPTALTIGALTFYGWAHTLQIVGFAVPRKLFAVNGYGGVIPGSGMSANTRPTNPGPLNKYQFALLFPVPVVGLLVLALTLITAYMVAIVLALIKITIA